MREGGDPMRDWEGEKQEAFKSSSTRLVEAWANETNDCKETMGWSQQSRARASRSGLEPAGQGENRESQGSAESEAADQGGARGCRAAGRSSGDTGHPPPAGLHIGSAGVRSSETTAAGFSPPRHETFGLRATVISNASLRLAHSPDDLEDVLPLLATGGSVCSDHSQNKGRGITRGMGCPSIITVTKQSTTPI